MNRVMAQTAAQNEPPGGTQRTSDMTKILVPQVLGAPLHILIWSSSYEVGILGALVQAFKMLDSGSQMASEISLPSFIGDILHYFSCCIALYSTNC